MTRTPEEFNDWFEVTHSQPIDDIEFDDDDGDTDLDLEWDGVELR